MTDDFVPVDGVESPQTPSEGGEPIDALLNDVSPEGGSEMGAPAPETPTDYFGWLSESLRNTEPDPPLSEIEAPFDPDGGISRVFRGIQKFAGFDASEAWFDIAWGLVEYSLGIGNQPPGSASSPDSQAQGNVVDSFNKEDIAGNIPT